MFRELAGGRPAVSERKLKSAAVVLIGVAHVALWFGFSVISSTSRMAVAPQGRADEKRTTVVWISAAKPIADPVTPPAPPAPLSIAPASVARTSKRHAASHEHARTMQSLPERQATTTLPAAPADVPAGEPNEPVSGTAKAGAGEASPKFDYSKVAGVLKDFDRGSARGRASGSELKETSTEKLGKEISKAKRANCETAYSHMGLLAIPFLLKDTVTDKGCKW